MPEYPLDAETRTFLFSHADAAGAFPGVEPWRVVLAVLASTSPEASWQGLLVHEAAPPAGRARTTCVCVAGPGASEAARRLAEAFGAVGILVEGTIAEDPEPIGPVVEASSGAWV